MKFGITSSLVLTYTLSFSQSLSLKDSLNLKKDIDSVLSKYGFKNSPYTINVKSKNQKGGQTAFIINNNYYGDTASNDTNFGFFDTILNGEINVFVFPKTGVWASPFIAYDSAATDVMIGISYSLRTISRNFLIGVDGIPIAFVVETSQSPSSINAPIRVMLKSKDAFFFFGDRSNKDRIYRYFSGNAFKVLQYGK